MLNGDAVVNKHTVAVATAAHGLFLVSIGVHSVLLSKLMLPESASYASCAPP